MRGCGCMNFQSCVYLGGALGGLVLWGARGLGGQPDERE